jgi:MoxR-like ATPase
VRKPFVALIGKLRSAGLSVSDRRSVKLQRLVAASAVLAGRWQAHTTDLWVLRYIWDTEEQREILAALVHQAIEASPPEQLATSHPRARQGDAPDAEELARDLRQLAEQLEAGAMTAEEKTVLRDRLGLLASRVPWVAEPQAREFLSEHIEQLWQQMGVEA